MESKQEKFYSFYMEHPNDTLNLLNDLHFLKYSKNRVPLTVWIMGID